MFNARYKDAQRGAARDAAALLLTTLMLFRARVRVTRCVMRARSDDALPRRHAVIMRYESTTQSRLRGATRHM